jgi:MYXO-CTERM domain-containing protein
MVSSVSKRPFGHGLAAGIAFAVLLLAAPAWARKGGLASQGCSGCHSGGATPTVTITSDPAVFMPGQTVTLSVAITTPSVAGLYMTASVGPLASLAGEGTQIISGGITHTTPKRAVNGVATFRVGWTAPAAPGGADFIAYVVAGNGDGGDKGDGPGMGFNAFVFGCTGQTFYRDFDGDGYAGAQSGYTKACTQPMYYVSQMGDCNDSDERIHPGAPEKCNKQDDNCDGKIDEGLPIVTYHVDMDGDGHGVAAGPTVTDCAPPKGYGVGTDDCDDTKPYVYAGAMELCNYTDDNCNGQVDEGARVACGMGWCRRLGAGCGSTDCTPGQPRAEVCNAFDDDCDGVNDNGTDLQLCGEPGMVCVDGTCYKAGTAPPPDAGRPITGASGATGLAGVGEPNLQGTAGSAGSRNGAEVGCAVAPAPAAPLVLVLVLLLVAVLARRRPSRY